MFTFVMEVEGLDFKATLDLLARKAGVDLEQYRSAGDGRKSGPNKERLYEVLELAAKFYQVQFSKNKIALEYALGKRKFTKETALEWRLGYSPNNGSALVEFARSKKFTDEEIAQAGLSSKRYNGVGDMFRGRLMIPLQDAQGRVIGFTARLLEVNDQAPKYINTPQTVLYDKSRHVYGLHLAKEAIRKGQYAVLVEGNLDVISSHQAGVKQVVATAGTALTEPHLKTLSRFTGDIRLCFDADKAGVAATERAIPIASRVKVSLSIIDIPSGKDPDDLIKQDPALWEKAVQSHRYALDWLIARYEIILDVKSAQGKRQFTDVLLPVVRGLSDDVERDHYLSAIAKTVGVSQEALGQKYDKTTGTEQVVRRKQIKTTPQQLDKAQVEYQKSQDQFLCLVLMRPTLREFLSIITDEMFITDQAKALFAFLRANPDFYGKPEQAKELKNLSDYVKIESLLYEELYQGLELNDLHYEVARLQTRLIEQFVKIQKQKLVSQFESVSEATQRELLTQVKQYDELLRQVKGVPTRGEEQENT